MAFPTDRPRRLRRTAALRRLVEETRLHPADLVLPLFVKEGIADPQPVASMPGVVQHTLESLRKAATTALEAGVGGLILFGIPDAKDALGSQADADDGIVQQALRALRADLGADAVLMADLCLCEYTDHGHCGPLTADRSTVDNDVTLVRYASVAVAQVEAGADIVAPSGMMDGQVAVIRDAIDDGRVCGPGDPCLRRQVRLCLLRPVPGRSREHARLSATGVPTRWTRPTPMRRCARSSPTSSRARTPSW